MQIVVNKILTHYDTAGKGKTVLILHGWGDDSRSWKKLQKDLAKDFQVITIDLPGFGASGAPETDWYLDDYAGFIRDFLVKIKKTELYAIISHSNGGAITVRGVAKGVLNPGRLVLLGSAGIRNEYKGRNKALRYVTKAGKALTAPLPKSTKKSIREKVYKTVGSDMLVAEHLQGTFKNIVEDDVRDDAAAIAVPTLLIYGENDVATPPRYGKIFQEHIKSSDLHVIPNAEHFVYQDKSDETTKLIKEFL